MAIAARPTMAWPIDPMARESDARRWAATIGAAVQVASVASASIASQLPARSTLTGPELEQSLLQAFESLPLGALSLQLDSLAEQGVTLDLAETSAVRVQLADGGALSLDPSGATLTRSGAVRFAFAGGVLDGSNYMMALDQTTVASMARARSQRSGEEAMRSATAGAAAGIK